jgi:Pyruvate/2-oxoacid:ferredoxin oxidoreductase delta subunit
MPAYAKEVSAAKGEGIRIEYLAAPVALHNDGRQLGKLECIRTRMGELDSDGRHKPIRIENSNFTINVDTVLTAIGELPDLSFLPESIEMAGALVEVDELNQTSIPGVFAGGDITNEAWNVSEAIGSGKRAAIGIDVYLKGEKGQKILESIGKSQGKAVSMEKYLRGESPVNEDGVITSSELNMRYLGKGPRIDLEKCSSARMDKDFDEVHLGFSMAEAVEEAKRCFHCGHCNLCGNCFIFCPDRAIALDEAASLLVLNSSLCKGCGICINECPRGAMAWEGDRNG